MFKYRYVNNGRRWIRRLGIVVETGDVFESPHELNDASYEPVKEDKKRAASVTAEED